MAAIMLHRLSKAFGITAPDKQWKQSPQRHRRVGTNDTVITIDLSTSGPLGEKNWRPKSEIFPRRKRHDSLLDRGSVDLAMLLREPEMSTVLKGRGRTGHARTINVQGVLVSLTDERAPEIIGDIPHLRTTWTFNMIDQFKYDVDDQILRLAMAITPIAVCNHLLARAPDGYGESSTYLNWPPRQADEDSIPDDGFRLSVRCKSCDATCSVDVASTLSPHWDGSCEPYLRIHSWRSV